MRIQDLGVGDIVLHKYRGKGEILEVIPSRGFILMSLDSRDYPRKGVRDLRDCGGVGVYPEGYLVGPENIIEVYSGFNYEED